MAEGELSTRIMIFPSKIEAAAVSGRSENLNLGNGLNHLWGDVYKRQIDRGVLYTSGMIAGEGLVGIMLAVFAIIPLSSARGGYLGDFINLSALDNGLGAFLVSPAAKIVSLIVFALLMLTMCKFTIWHKENRK